MEAKREFWHSEIVSFLLRENFKILAKNSNELSREKFTFFLGITAFKGGKNYFEMDLSSNCVCME